MRVEPAVPGSVGAGNLSWWRRGDSTFRGFRRGLDYAFIRDAQLIELSDAERVIRTIASIPDPSTRPSLYGLRRVYESLQGRPEVGLLPTPRRCHAACVSAQRRQVSPM